MLNVALNVSYGENSFWVFVVKTREKKIGPIYDVTFMTDIMSENVTKIFCVGTGTLAVDFYCTFSPF